MKTIRNLKNWKSSSKFKMTLLKTQTLSDSKEIVQAFLMMIIRSIHLSIKIKKLKMKFKIPKRVYSTKIWKKKTYRESNRFSEKEKILQMLMMRKDKMQLISNSKIWKTSLWLRISMIFSALNKTKKFLAKIFLKDFS